MNPISRLYDTSSFHVSRSWNQFPELDRRLLDEARAAKTASSEHVLDGFTKISSGSTLACLYRQGASWSDCAQPGMGLRGRASSSSDSESEFSRYGEIWYENSAGAPESAGFADGVRAVGEETSRTFETVGEHSVWLETRTRAYASRVVCRYVRREIRSLSDDDREAFFRAAGVLYATPDAEGARAYGRAYKSAAYFIATHNELSGDRTCDHFHDGLGFLPQHAAFTLRFERALQSVDPKVSVPYWDYTIEAYDVAVAGDMAAWRRSPVFRDDWFGDAQPEGHVVNAGRWAYTAVARASSADTANAYGLIRAPWNVNKVPYLTRANTTFGFSLSDVPSCADHYSVMQTTAWSDFGVDVQYNAHGTVHAMIGGVTGADLRATLLGLGMRAIPAENIALEAFATQQPPT